MRLTDLALARRLERTEGAACASFVEARAAADPSAPAEWIEVGGVYAMFDGIGSPMTQTFGLGVFEPPTLEHMDRIEGFFRDRGSATAQEVSPLAGLPVARMMCERGYLPVEMSQVMFMELGRRPDIPPADVHVRTTRNDEGELWARTAAEGWTGLAPTDGVIELMRLVVGRDKPTFLAEIEGVPVATAAYFEHDGVALLAGASTVPQWRNRGAQRALFLARLEHAAATGCELAMVVAEPGSASQRNAERQGFRIAYTRTKWERPFTA